MNFWKIAFRVCYVWNFHNFYNNKAKGEKESKVHLYCSNWYLLKKRHLTLTVGDTNGKGAEQQLVSFKAAMSWMKK